MTEQTARLASLVVETNINASPDRVWQGLTQHIGEWWPVEFYTGSEATMEMELWPGGRVFETSKGGGGTLWGSVVSFVPNQLLQVVGHQFPDWGGPSEWYGTWQLQAKGGQTQLTYSEATLGQVSTDGLQQKDAGWQFISACLKAHVEGNPPPVWSD